MDVEQAVMVAHRVGKIVERGEPQLMEYLPAVPICAVLARGSDDDTVAILISPGLRRIAARDTQCLGDVQA